MQNIRIHLICWAAISILIIGCSNSGNGNGNGDSSNENINDNESAPDSNANDNNNNDQNSNDNTDESVLSVEIIGLPIEDAEVGQAILLTAQVSGAEGDLSYLWSTDSPDYIDISGVDSATPTLTASAPGDFLISAVVTDSQTGATAQSDAIIMITASSSPPGEASIDAVDLPPITPNNQLVTLTANITGPTPTAITWSADAGNPLSEEALFFEDLDTSDSWATFYASTLLNFTYQLTFTVTATYSNGSTISDSTAVTIMGGP